MKPHSLSLNCEAALLKCKMDLFILKWFNKQFKQDNQDSIFNLYSNNFNTLFKLDNQNSNFFVCCLATGTRLYYWSTLAVKHRGRSFRFCSKAKCFASTALDLCLFIMTLILAIHLFWSSSGFVTLAHYIICCCRKLTVFHFHKMYRPL